MSRARSRSVLKLVLASTVALFGCLPDQEQPAPESISDPIVGGTVTTECQWPTCLSAGGCTNTLVHPKLVTTAKHCLGSTPRSLTFGETRGSPKRTVMVDRCVRHPTRDIGFCILAAEVTGIPIVPLLATCEAKEMLKPGYPVTLVGYGITSATGGGSGTKRMVTVPINSLSADGTTINIGNATMGGCHGDSGGPAYIKMPDGTWRAFGSTHGAGPGGPDCAGTGIWSVLSASIDWIEKESGLDVTPCHSPTGAWEGGPACDRFPTNPGGAGGTWAMMCAEQPVAKPMPTCTGVTPPPQTDGGTVPPPADARPDVRSDAPTGNDTRPDTGPATPDANTPADRASTPEAAADVNTPPFMMPDAGLPPGNPGPDAGAPGVKPGVVTDGGGCGCAAGGPNTQPTSMLFAAFAVLLAFRLRNRG